MLQLQYLKRTLKYEGIYSNTKYDKGGETFRGIARNYFPNWEGWKFIDEANGDISKIYELDKNPKIQELVVKFYNENFYNKIKGEILEEIISPEFAWYVFDTAVNTGFKTALKILQNSINKTTGSNLLVDGIIGNKTLNALKEIKTDKDKERLYCNYKSYRVLYYTNITVKNPKYLKFIKGWIKRAVEI